MMPSGQWRGNQCTMEKLVKQYYVTQRKETHASNSSGEVTLHQIDRLLQSQNYSYLFASNPPSFLCTLVETPDITYS